MLQIVQEFHATLRLVPYALPMLRGIALSAWVPFPSRNLVSFLNVIVQSDFSVNTPQLMNASRVMQNVNLAPLLQQIAWNVQDSSEHSLSVAVRLVENLQQVINQIVSFSTVSILNVNNALPTPIQVALNARISKVLSILVFYPNANALRDSTIFLQQAKIVQIAKHARKSAIIAQ